MKDTLMTDSNDTSDTATDTPGNLIAEAQDLIKRNHLSEAEQICNKLVAANPDDVDALYALGWIALCHEKVDIAVEKFRRVIDLQPGHGRAHYNLGTILMTSGRLTDAAEHFEAAVAADPGFSDAFCNLGSLRLIGGRIDEAIKNFRAAIDLTPDHADAHYGLANALVKDKYGPEAVEHYRRAIAIKPDFAEAHNALGVCFIVIDEPEKAEACFEKALEIKPDFPKFHNNLAIALRRSGKLKQSMASARAALEADPQSVEAYSNLGKALELDDQHEAALATYKKALAVNTDGSRQRHSAAHAKIGVALQSRGRFKEAIDHFEAAGDGKSSARALECYFALGRVEDFDKSLRKLCESDPKNLVAAGISAFAAHQWRKEDPYPFCKNPLEFVDIRNVGSQFASFEAFSEDLLKELQQARTVWEPRKNTTVKGYHTIGNIFHLGSPTITALHDLISRQIEEYRTAYADRTNFFVAHWPRNASLEGWHVKVAKDGYQTHHIHPSSWLSGVIYLKMPTVLDPEEGSITFSLRVPNVPIIDEDIPTLRHAPKEGDIVLFPSSLYHYTRPFSADGERHVVAFDLYPTP